jgi:hypothetical protein
VTTRGVNGRRRRSPGFPDFLIEQLLKSSAKQAILQRSERALPVKDGTPILCSVPGLRTPAAPLPRWSLVLGHFLNICVHSRPFAAVSRSPVTIQFPPFSDPGKNIFRHNSLCDKNIYALINIFCENGHFAS